jgi:hypothetical protein
VSALKNKRRIWEPEEDEQLREMVGAGKSLTLKRARLKRTETAVRQRLHLLKISIRDEGKKRPAGRGRRA